MYAACAFGAFCIVNTSSMRGQSKTQKADVARDYLHRGQAALRANQKETAVQEFQKVLILEPENIEANANLGVIEFFDGDCKDAEPRLKAALGSHPTLSRERAFLAICEKRMGQPKAMADLELLFSQLNDSKLRTMVGFELASLYYQKGDLGHAASVLQILIKLDPDNPDILYFAQLVYSELADNTLNKLALLAPNSARMQEVIAEKLVNSGNLKNAVDHYRNALALDPYLPGAHYELAEALLESSPNDTQAQADALHQLDLSLQVDGENTKTESLLGLIAFSQGKQKSAFNHYQRAIQLNPDDEDAQMGLSKILMEQNQPQQALVYLQKVVGVDPLNAEAHYRLAMAYKALNRKDEEEQQLHVFQEIKKAKDQVKNLYREMNQASAAGEGTQQKSAIK